jgi:hypothetical protein
MPAVAESIADEVARLVDLKPVELATAVLQEAEAWLNLSKLKAQVAEHNATRARAAAADLVAQEIAGETPSEALPVEDVFAAHDLARRLETYATHRAAVYRARHEPVEKAQAALAAAKHAAWETVMLAGQDYRIRAAAKVDQARMLAACSDDASGMQRALAAAASEKALVPARAEWDRGTELISIAMRNGHRWKGIVSMAQATWADMPREAYERRYWRRPLAEEIDHAHAA